MLNEAIKATGQLNIVLRSSDGEVKEEMQVENLVVTTGREYIAGRMEDGGPSAMSHMAIGTGTTGALPGDTSLETEISRVTIDAASGASGTQKVYVAEFPAGVPGSLTAITEAGIFNNPTAGAMLARTTFAPVNKDVNDSLTITWTISFTAS